MTEGSDSTKQSTHTPPPLKMDFYGKNFWYPGDGYMLSTSNKNQGSSYSRYTTMKYINIETVT